MKQDEAMAKWTRRLELLEQVKSLRNEIKALEDELGLSDIVLKDDVPGTDLSEWLCTKCGRTFVVKEKGLCPVCHAWEDEK